MKRMILFVAIFSLALIATVFLSNQYGPGAVGFVAAHSRHASMATPF